MFVVLQINNFQDLVLIIIFSLICTVDVVWSLIDTLKMRLSWQASVLNSELLNHCCLYHVRQAVL